MRKKILSFHCECALQRNNLDINLSKGNKSRLKTLNLFAFYDNEVLNVSQAPYLQISEINSDEIALFKCSVPQIKKILRPYIMEGKITIEISEETNSQALNSRLVNASDMSLKNSIKIENSSFLFVSQSSKEMLTHFCQVLADLHTKMKAIKTSALENSSDQPKSQINKTQSISQKSNAGSQAIQNITNQTTQEESKKSSDFIGRKKINRELLSQHSSRIPELIPAKRNFASLKENSIPANIKAIPKPNNMIPNPSPLVSKRFFENLPELVLKNIVDFLPKQDFKKLILINKDFNRLVWKYVRHINLNTKPEIPPNFLRKFLTQATSVDVISFGRMKNVNPGFLCDILGHQFPLSLKEADFSRYSKMNDKILIKFLLNAKGLEIIRLPYLSQLSNNSLLTLDTYLKGNLKFIDLKYDGPCPIQSNTNITDTSVHSVISRNQGLLGFNLAYVSNIFIENFLKEGIPETLSNRLRVIKITNFVLQNNLALMNNLVCFKQFSNLEYLKIINIVFKNQYNLFEKLRPETSIIEQIFKGCGELTKIKFGAWFNNEMVLLAAENLKGLKHVSFKNNEEIEDESMEILLNSLSGLETLDISQCIRVSGNCLEGIISRNLEKLVVSCDDHNLKCTEAILQEKGLTKTQIFNKIKRK